MSLINEIKIDSLITAAQSQPKSKASTSSKSQTTTKKTSDRTSARWATSVEAVMDALKMSKNSYNDPKKVSINKTPKGNWELCYGGKEVSTIAPMGAVDIKALKEAGVKFEYGFDSKTKTQDSGDIKTLSSKDFDKNPKLLDSLLKNANVKKNDKGETFYHVTISSHGVKKHNLWLSKPEVKSRLSIILNPYDEVTAVSKEDDDVVSKEVKKKIASIKPHIVTDAALGKVEYFDYDENKKKRLHDLSSDAAWLSNGKSKNLGFDYKTDDGRSVHIDIKVTKNKKENTFEIKNGSKGDTIEFSISNQMSYDVQNKELDDKIKESIESRVNKGIKTPASKNKIETDGSKLTLTQRKQNLSNVVDKFKTAIQDKIKELKLNSEYKIETGDRYISVSRKNNNFRKGAGSGGTFAFDYNGKGNKLMITRKAPLSGSTEFDFDENDIKDNVDKFFRFYSIK